MKNTTWSLEDVALSMYAYMQLNEEFDTFVTDRYKKEINDALLKISEQIENHIDYIKEETLFTLIYNYGEMRSKSSFIDGFRSGIEANIIK